jgi:heptosyltransferase-1
VADVAVRVAPHVHAVRRSRLLCAQALGYPLSDSELFGLRALAGKALIAPEIIANDVRPTRPCVALVHGTSRADKQWPKAHWLELARRLDAAGCDVALLHGTDAEQQRSEAMAREMAHALVWPRLALDALTDALAGCTGVIGVDSGLSHIAVALDLPHVQIYNFDTAWRTGPGEGGLAPQPRQCSVYAAPSPSVDAVWQAWLRVRPT